ncbi:MAG: DEAD/DEAH box helicase, partial [Candidatus Aminicenantes bacterium]|nr:DEAD/DEAH box helicase [Candidatus Aminicenantes bacterium]
MKKKENKHNALEIFHPLVNRWFREKVGTPTDIQERAWPQIAKGNHTLITAPTGSGKTLTAFLWAINNFLVSKQAAENIRVLYISPLKALNNDIRRNLQKPLQELRTLFAEQGEKFPEIRAAVRSGDTEPAERREMMRFPPEIFITTPESLNILLSSKGGRRALLGISTVILDEIHAVLPTKRGTYLISAVDRLVPMCGDFQRIAISATIKPLDLVADFIGGYKLKASRGHFAYEKRRVTIVKSDIKKEYEISVNLPEKAKISGKKAEWWPALTDAFRQVIGKNRSSLFFANSRRMVEKVTRFINDGLTDDQVYSHHGSLSKEIRSVVEKRFKEGELSGIISTSSLELGIDIGSVDQVVLIQSPFSIAAAIQRIGRSGHGVGQVSRGLFYPLHNRAFLEAAVIAANIDSEEIEPAAPVLCPLDVLAQVLLSMTLLENRDLNELYAEIRTSYPFFDLKRKEFDLVVEMLAGRYADSRIRELKARLLVDRVDNSAKARKNAAMLLYLSGGVIPDRGYFNLRAADSKAKIGELDEEFVWERSLGEAFPFGNQVWRIKRITHNDVEVTRVTKSNTLVPFWRADEMNRSFFLSEKIGCFLEEAEAELKNAAFKEILQQRNHMSAAAADELIGYLKRQRDETGVPLPHRRHLLVEHFRDPANLSDAKQTVLHTLWGGKVNRPFAFALAAAWEEKYKYPLEVFVNNDCIMLNLPHEFSARDIIDLVRISRLRQLLRKKLESTGYFGARFRQNAQFALLLPRQSFHKRMPLWLNRLRSKKLLEAVSGYDDFPILLETWRQCMNRDFEIDTLIHLLEEIGSGEIQVSEVITKKPSPFTDGVIWRQTNKLMYEGDSPASKLRTGLSDNLLKEVLYSSHLRPRFSGELILELQRKLHRIETGYAPGSGDELLQWVKERLYVPADEWWELLAAVERDHEIDSAELLEEIAGRLYPVLASGGEGGVFEKLPPSTPQKTFDNLKSKALLPPA